MLSNVWQCVFIDTRNTNNSTQTNKENHIDVSLSLRCFITNHHHAGSTVVKQQRA